jgi:tRNA pseudouridine-54 N-methylase
MSLLNANFDVAAYLIQKGANVNKWDLYGQTPLYIAVDLNTLPHGHSHLLERVRMMHLGRSST